MDDCIAHLELIIVQSQPGMTEYDFHPSAHNWLTPPSISGDSLSENETLTEQTYVYAAV